MLMDALTVLKRDHEEIKGLFRTLERLWNSEEGQDSERLLSVSYDILQSLTVHNSIEEEIFYPFVRDNIAEAQEIVLQSEEEHHIVENSIAELQRLKQMDGHFKAKITVLMNLVDEHIDKEELEVFPLLRDRFGRRALGDLGQKLLEARRVFTDAPRAEQPTREAQPTQPVPASQPLPQSTSQPLFEIERQQYVEETEDLRST